MYCATPDGTGCDCPSESGNPRTLAGYGYYSDPFSSFDAGVGAPLPGFQLDAGGPFASTPGGYSSSLDVGDFLGGVWREAKNVLGDVADDLGNAVVEWIQRRVGQEAWERMPDSSRREVLHQAANELTGGLAAPNVLPWVLAGGALLVVLGLRR